MKRKKQHYVPKFYLKNFTDNNFLSIYNIEKNEIITNAYFESQCYKKYYYGEDGTWEELLGKYEKEWAKLFRDIIGNSKYILNDDEKSLIKQFSIIQLIRTPSREKFFKEVAWESFKVPYEMQLKKEKIPISKELLEYSKKHFDTEYMQNIPKQNLEKYEEYLEHIEDLSVCILEYTCNTKLISSDNPIMKYNNFITTSLGFRNAGLVLFFPINSEKLIVIFDEKMYPKYKDKQYYKINNSKEVEVINSFIYTSADKIVFYKDEKYNIKSVMKKYKKSRDEYVALMKPYAIGTEFDKYIMAREPIIPLDYDFSFSKVRERARKFNAPEIDWFPRKSDKEYIERIKNRKIIVNNKIIKETNEFNLKKLKEFNRFIYDFWDDRL